MKKKKNRRQLQKILIKEKEISWVSLLRLLHESNEWDEKHEITTNWSNTNGILQWLYWTTLNHHHIYRSAINKQLLCVLSWFNQIKHVYTLDIKISRTKGEKTPSTLETKKKKKKSSKRILQKRFTNMKILIHDFYLPTTQFRSFFFRWSNVILCFLSCYQVSLTFAALLSLFSSCCVNFLTFSTCILFDFCFRTHFLIKKREFFIYFDYRIKMVFYWVDFRTDWNKTTSSWNYIEWNSVNRQILPERSELAYKRIFCFSSFNFEGGNIFLCF